MTNDIAMATRHRAGSPGCKCIADFDAQMAKHGSNTIVMTEVFSGAVVVASCKAEEKKRGKPAAIVASYCPFCGRAYADKDGTSEEPRP